MTRGNIAEFLTFVAQNEGLQRDLVELAARYGFEFTDGDIRDDDMEQVVGGRGGTTIVIIDPKMRGR